jgi:hypothetical protein
LFPEQEQPHNLAASQEGACVIDTSAYSNNMATYKLLSNIKQSILNGKQKASNGVSKVASQTPL